MNLKSLQTYLCVQTKIYQRYNMARYYLVGEYENPVTGEQLIEFSIQLFDRRGTHKCGKSARPRTIAKAVWFLKNVLHIPVKTKLDTENEWKIAQ
jgi:hypothetical protein